MNTKTITSEELAKAIANKTLVELGRLVVKNNQERKEIRKQVRLIKFLEGVN